MKHVTSEAIEQFEKKWGGEELTGFGSYDDLETLVAVCAMYRVLVVSGNRTHEIAFSIAWDTVAACSDYEIFGTQSSEVFEDLSNLLQDFDFTSLTKISQDFETYDEGILFSLFMLSVEELIKVQREEFEEAEQDRIEALKAV